MTVFDDEKYIKLCFELALRADGQVSPNPLVGSVLVKNGFIIGQGFHRKAGEDHAEIAAIKSCSESVEGATLYCNLEPCCHFKKRTPPCVDFLIEKKIKKVVISNLDPNPHVSGKGVEKLKSAGIEVVVGILEKEGAKLNEVFFKNMKTGLPFIHLKFAQTLDGRIADVVGNSKWISDEAAREQVHLLRKKYDGILVGKNTLQRDNPSLTVRIADQPEYSKKRFVLSNSLNLNQPNQYKLFNDEWKDKSYVLRKKESLVSTLKEMKVMNNTSSLLVEGGSQVISTFIKEGLYDKVTIYIAPKFLGNGQSCFNDETLGLDEELKFSNIDIKNINGQVMFEAYNKDSVCSLA